MGRTPSLTTMSLPTFLRFPNPVNEIVARLVAAGVMLLAVTYLLTGWTVVVVALAAGFVARVLFGPRVSPLALLVNRVIVPRLGWAERLVPGPPKRFAQGVGAALTVPAAVLAVGAGQVGAAQLLVACVVVAASLESILGFCLGCRIFAVLMRVGIIAPSVCEACNDLSTRLSRV